MERDVYRCDSCGHITVPAGLARRADGSSIYESDDAIFDADGNADYYLDETNAAAARAKLGYVASFCPEGRRLFDVGASFGHFLAEAQKRYRASGIEVSPSSVTWARSHFRVAIDVGSVYDLSSRYGGAGFDAITMWDVIEHLEDPVRAVDEVRACLAPRGLLFLSTPDAGSLVARLMGRRWHYLDPVQHLNLFSGRNLARLLAARGFTLVHGRHFGRGYRLSYIVNRLRYLATGRSSSALGFLNLTVPIKLWDVGGFVFQAAA